MDGNYHPQMVGLYWVSHVRWNSGIRKSAWKTVWTCSELKKFSRQVCAFRVTEKGETVIGWQAFVRLLTPDTRGLPSALSTDCPLIKVLWWILVISDPRLLIGPIHSRLKLKKGVRLQAFPPNLWVAGELGIGMNEFLVVSVTGAPCNAGEARVLGNRSTPLTLP